MTFNNNKQILMEIQRLIKCNKTWLSCISTPTCLQCKRVYIANDKRIKIFKIHVMRFIGAMIWAKVTKDSDRWRWRAFSTINYLIRNGLEVGVETDGNRAVLLVNNQILWSWMSCCRGFNRLSWSSSTLPSTYFNARTEDMDQVLGLEMGADELNQFSHVYC